MSSDDSEINVKVTATTQDLASGLNKATGDVKDFGDEINNLAQRMAAVKPDAFKALAQEFNNGKLDLDEFRDGLVGMSSASTAASTEMAALGQASHLSSAGMRELVVVGRELASGNLTRLPGSLSILTTRLGLLSPAGILAAAGIAAVGYAIYEAIESSEKFESELKTIQNSLTAIGEGNSFDKTQITEYVDILRQIPGVNRDAAASMVDEFSRARNVVENNITGELVPNLQKFALLIGKEVPQAAKEMAAAFDDPVKGLQLLKQSGVELSATQQEQIKEMMAVNDVAGAQRVLFDGISTAMAHVVDTTTPMQRALSDIGARLSGVSIQARHAQEALLGAAAAAEKAGDMDAGRAFRERAAYAGGDARNLPAGGASQPNPQAQAAKEAEERTARLNEQLETSQKLDEKINSPLEEQLSHRQRILILQQGINAAEELGNQAAVKRNEVALEAENKKYYGNSGAKADDKSDESAARAAAEGADAEIQEQRRAVEEKRQLGQISVADSVRQLESLAAQEHAINLKRIADMRAVYARQGDRAGLASSQGDTQKENARYSGDVGKIDSAGQEEQQKIDQSDIESNAKVAEAKLKTAEEVAKEQYELGQTTAQQELATLTNSARQENAIEMAKFDQLASLYQNDLAKFKEVQAQKAEAQQRFDQQINALNTAAAKAQQTQEQQQQQQFDQSAQKMVGPWENALTQMSNGTKTWQQTVTQAARQTETQFVGTLVRNMVSSWILGETVKTSATATGNAIRTASDQAAASASSSAASSGNQETIMDDAYTAAANVYANVSAIPYVGWVLAPAAAAVAFAAVAGFGMNLNSAAGGMIVDGDQIARVHDNEMVLPARYTGGLTKMIDQANGGGNGAGANHFHFSPQINGRLGPDDIDGLHTAFGNFIQKGIRNGQFGSMRRT